MSAKVERVFTGWLNLTDSEKEDLLKEISKFKQKKTDEQKIILKEASIVTGPIGGSCPCCGR